MDHKDSAEDLQQYQQQFEEESKQMQQLKQEQNVNKEYLAGLQIKKQNAKKMINQNIMIINSKIGQQIQNGQVQINQQGVANNFRQSNHNQMKDLYQKFRTQNINKLSDKIRESNLKLNKQLQLLKFCVKKQSSSTRSHTKYTTNPETNFQSNKQDQQLLLPKTSITTRQLQQYKNRQKQSALKLKELKRLKEEANQKRKSIEKRKQMKLQDQTRREEEEQKMSRQKQKEEKRRLIQQKLRKFQQNKQFRAKILEKVMFQNPQNTENKTINKNKSLSNGKITNDNKSDQASNKKSSPNILPKYKKMKSQFQAEQIFRKNEQQRNYKNQIKQRFKQYEFQRIKQHERQYMSGLKSRLGSRKHKTQQNNQFANQINNIVDKKQMIKKQLGFRLLGRDNDTIQQQKRKRQKIKQFDDLKNKIKIKVNSEKNLQLQINKDKSQNPMKYNFLKQKNFTQQQIFNQFKNFNIETNSTKIGNQYLNQIKERNKSSRALDGKPKLHYKTQQSSISSQRIVYKNYLQESRKNTIKTPSDPKIQQQLHQKRQIQRLMRQYGDKSKVIQILQQQSQVYKAKAVQKIIHMKKLESQLKYDSKDNNYNYNKSIKVENEIDEHYINSIKKKIKCIGIS